MFEVLHGVVSLTVIWVLFVASFVVLGAYYWFMSKRFRPTDPEGKPVTIKFPPRYWLLISVPMLALAVISTAVAVLAARFDPPVLLLWGITLWCWWQAFQSRKPQL